MIHAAFVCYHITAECCSAWNARNFLEAPQSLLSTWATHVSPSARMHSAEVLLPDRHKTPSRVYSYICCGSHEKRYENSFQDRIAWRSKRSCI